MDALERVSCRHGTEGEADDPLFLQAEVAVHAGVDSPHSGQPFDCQFVWRAPVCQPLADHLEVGVLKAPIEYERWLLHVLSLFPFFFPFFLPAAIADRSSNA